MRAGLEDECRETGRSGSSFPVFSRPGFAAGQAGTPGFLETIDAFEKPKLAETSAQVANLKLTTGHFTCTLTLGRAAYVMLGSERVGIYFDGSGTMEYESVDPIEAPVVTFVADKSSGLKPEKSAKGVRLRDKFTRLLWLAVGEPLPELTGLGPLPLSAGLRAHEEMFRERRGSPRSFGFALERFNAPTAPYVWVEAEGGEDPFVYVRDGMENPTESLRVLRSRSSNEVEIKNALFPVLLSRQPSGWDPGTRPSPASS